jgi:hypothetical protein
MNVIASVAMSGFMVFVILAAAVAVVASIYFAKDARARRKLAGTRVEAIAQATPGTTARFTGTIEALADQLTAPMSGRRCVYYLAVVQEYRSSGKSGNWVEILRDEQHVDFLVRDGTGAAHVRMDAPHVVAVRDHNTRSGTFDDATAIEAAFLQQFSKESTNFLGLNRSLRYSEGALELGEEITVLGATRPGDGDIRLVIESPAEGQLLLTDHPRTVRAQP